MAGTEIEALDTEAAAEVRVVPSDTYPAPVAPRLREVASNLRESLGPAAWPHAALLNALAAEIEARERMTRVAPGSLAERARRLIDDVIDGCYGEGDMVAVGERVDELVAEIAIREAHPSALRDALEALLVRVGLKGLSIKLTAWPEDYPEARGRHAADTVCRLLAEAAGIAGDPKHLAYGYDPWRMATLRTPGENEEFGSGLRITLRTHYEEGGS